MRSRDSGQRGGYIAVTAAIIISAVIITIAVVFSSTNFLGRFDTQLSEMKDITRELAEGCVEYARLKLSGNPSYGGNETVSIGAYSCTLLPLEAEAGAKVIKSTATVQDKTTNLKANVSDQTLDIISREEVDNF